MDLLDHLSRSSITGRGADLLAGRVRQAVEPDIERTIQDAGEPSPEPFGGQANIKDDDSPPSLVDESDDDTEPSGILIRCLRSQRVIPMRRVFNLSFVPGSRD